MILGMIGTIDQLEEVVTNINIQKGLGTIPDPKQDFPLKILLIETGLNLQPS